MVLGEQLKGWFEKREKERLDKARTEVQRTWSEWNQRRLDAEATREPFIEPPPDFSSPETNGSQ